MPADYYEYRITVNGSESRIFANAIPDGLWESAARAAEERGYTAKLERRFITDESFLALVENFEPFAKLPNGVVICHWETIASFNCKD